MEFVSTKTKMVRFVRSDKMPNVSKLLIGKYSSKLFHKLFTSDTLVNHNCSLFNVLFWEIWQLLWGQKSLNKKSTVNLMG